MKKNHKTVYTTNLEIVAFSVIKLWYKIGITKRPMGLELLLKRF